MRDGSGRCEAHPHSAQAKAADAARGNSNDRGYTWAWRQAALRFLKANPLCAICKKAGRVEPATVVDHIIPHRGNKDLFWDKNNWQALSKTCHDRKTAAEDGGLGNPRSTRAYG